MIGIRFYLLLLSVPVLCSPVLSDLILLKVDRKMDLTSHIVRTSSTLKVENAGSDAASEVLFPFPDHQVKNLASLMATIAEGKGRKKSSSGSLPIKIVHPEGMPPALTWYSVTLPKGLGEGESMTLEVVAVFSHSLQPFPNRITQAEFQLVVFQDSAYYLSPYTVQIQSLTVKTPGPEIESFTKLEKTSYSDSEIKYGPYENLPSFSYSPIVVHFVNNKPFPVAEKLVREIEISHWGNVQVTEHYDIVHAGAQITGEFSRLDFQARPHLNGASAFRHLIAKLPPSAHSVYYRDQIGNISTSNLWGDSVKTLLEIEPRYPMFGGWKTSFTIGYGLPLQDFLFQSEEKRFLNISFGCPMHDVVIDNLIAKIVLPEGARDISVSVPFEVKQQEEIKFSHLDMVGRPVVVLEKTNVVPEHNQYFQVYYKFNCLSLLREPLMLIFGFLFFFVTCIVYMHADLTLSKNSASYLARLQRDEVQATIQQLRSIVNRCLAIHDKLEASLRDLSRTGDVQACKAARKAADSSFKELSKELKPLFAFFQSSPQALQILPKVEDLVSKERELQEKLMVKHSMVVDCYEKKTGGKEIENRVSSIQHITTALRHEVDDLLEVIDEII